MTEVIMKHPGTGTPVIVQVEDEEEFLKRGFLPEDGSVAGESEATSGEVTADPDSDIPGAVEEVAPQADRPRGRVTESKSRRRR